MKKVKEDKKVVLSLGGEDSMGAGLVSLGWFYNKAKDIVDRYPQLNHVDEFFSDSLFVKFDFVLYKGEFTKVFVVGFKEESSFSFLSNKCECSGPIQAAVLLEFEAKIIKRTTDNKKYIIDKDEDFLPF